MFTDFHALLETLTSMIYINVSGRINCDIKEYKYIKYKLIQKLKYALYFQ
jgi:hypothetical protein